MVGDISILMATSKPSAPAVTRRKTMTRDSRRIAFRLRSRAEKGHQSSAASANGKGCTNARAIRKVTQILEVTISEELACGQRI
jgi:hypothetical protein